MLSLYYRQSAKLLASPIKVRRVLASEQEEDLCDFDDREGTLTNEYSRSTRQTQCSPEQDILIAIQACQS